MTQMQNKNWVEINNPKFLHFITAWHYPHNYLLSLVVESEDEEDSFFVRGCNRALLDEFQIIPKSVDNAATKLAKFSFSSSYDDPYLFYKKLKEEFDPFVQAIIIPVDCEFEKNFIKCDFEKNEIRVSTSCTSFEDGFKSSVTRVLLNFDLDPNHPVKHSPFFCTEEDYEDGFSDYFCEQDSMVEEETNE